MTPNTSLNLWTEQYPSGGFCFGPDKPTVDIVQEHGKQIVRFGGSALNGEIHECLYPDFSFKHWTAFVFDKMGLDWFERLDLKVDDRQLWDELRDRAGEPVQAMISPSATGELLFWDAFKQKISGAQCGYYSTDTGSDRWEAPGWIPALIPQVWVQWHSETVPELRKSGSPYTSQLQRIDFAAFWHDRRHAILIDGIQHYAVKRKGRWDASEEEYSKRLAEDRFFRANGWEVFRVSNWELRDTDRQNQIMDEFERHVGFEFFPKE